MKKLGLYLKLNVFYILRNKLRLFLTVFGIGLGLMIFIIGNTFVKGYIKTLYAEYDNFPKTAYLTIGTTEQVNTAIESKFNDYRLMTYQGPSDVSVPTKHNYKYEDVSVMNAVCFYGVDGNFSASAIPCYNNGKESLCNSRLLYGRLINDEDIKNSSQVAVIEKSSAISLFGRENCIGETTEIYGYFGYMTVEIVGIIEDTSMTLSRNMVFNSRLNSESEVVYTNYLYVPQSFYIKFGENTETKYIYLFDESQASQCDDYFLLLANNESLMNNGGMVMSYAVGIEEAGELENEMNGIIGIAFVAIVLITVFTIATIFIFSTKERIYEIGVRRALGASKTDISIQFMLEGLVYSIMSWLIAYVLSVFTCNVLHNFLLNKLYMDFSLIIDGKLVIASLGVAVLEGIICSCVPAVIAARVRPTEAIRVD